MIRNYETFSESILIVIPDIEYSEACASSWVNFGSSLRYSAAQREGPYLDPSYVIERKALASRCVTPFIIPHHPEPLSLWTDFARRKGRDLGGLELLL